MKILILGGTGAMGRHLADILSQRDDAELYISSRKARPSHGNIKYLQGNAHDRQFLHDVLQSRWDAIVDFMVYTTPEFKERALDLLDACGQYVFLSSARVYARSDGAIAEDSARLLDVCDDVQYLATDEYALAKARQEDILAGSGKTNWTIVRPYITFAENRLQLGALEADGWLPRALSGHAIVLSEDIARARTTMTYGLDVARGISALTGNPQALGKAFTIASPESRTWAEILNVYLDAIEEATGKRPRVKMVREFPGLDKAPNKYQVLYDRVYDRSFDTARINEFVDTGSFVSADEGLKKCVAEYIRSHDPADFALSARREARYDRISGENMDLKRFRGLKNKAVYVQQRYLPAATEILGKLKKIARKH